MSHQHRSLFDKIAQRFWMREARPEGVRERSDRINPVGPPSNVLTILVHPAHRAPTCQCYDQSMHRPVTRSDSGTAIDRSLVEWFAALTPDERLAELESRIDFFLSLRQSNELQLSRDSRTAEQA